MYFIVETDSNLERLGDLCREQGAYIEVVTTNDNYHPRLTGLVAVYVRPLYEEEDLDPINGMVLGTTGKGYIVPICHDESQGVDKEKVQDLISSIERDVYVLNKKSALYHFNLGKNVKDLNLKYAMNHYERMDLVAGGKTYNWYYNRHGGYPEVNQVIPISKIYEKCEDTFKKVKDIINEPEPAGFNFYNELATKAFYLVEQSGLRVDVHEFEQRFKPLNSAYSIDPKSGLVYTSYNLYNATSRPTNSFNSVNFLAIPKGKEFRRCFKPQNDRFVQFDYDGFHIRIVSELIGYDLDPNIKAHKQLARLRSGQTEFTAEEYSKAKAENFKMIYGSPSEEDAKLEISQKIQEYIKNLWKQYSRVWKGTAYVENGVEKQATIHGNISDPNSHKVFESMKDMYPSKLFNYLIQSIETSKNVLTLCKVLGYLARTGAKSKVILVTYDSFLVDYAESDGSGLLDNIRRIMSGETEHKINETPVFPLNIEESLDLNFD